MERLQKIPKKASSQSVTSNSSTLRTSATATSQNSIQRSNSLNNSIAMRTRARVSMSTGSPTIRTAGTQPRPSTSRRSPSLSRSVAAPSITSRANIMKGNNVTIKSNEYPTLSTISTRAQIPDSTSTALTSFRTSVVAASRTGRAQIMTSNNVTIKPDERRSTTSTTFRTSGTQARASTSRRSPSLSRSVVAASSTGRSQIMTSNEVTIKSNDTRSTRSQTQASTSTAFRTSGTQARASTPRKSPSLSRSVVAASRTGRAQIMTSNNVTIRPNDTRSTRSQTQASTSTAFRTSVVAASRAGRAQTMTSNNVTIRSNDTISTRSQTQASTSTAFMTSGTQARASTSRRSLNLSRSGLGLGRSSVLEQIITNRNDTISARSTRQAPTSTNSPSRTPGPSTSGALEQRNNTKRRCTMTTRSETRASTSTSPQSAMSSETNKRKRSSLDAQLESVETIIKKCSRVANKLKRISEELEDIEQIEDIARNVITCPVCFVVLNNHLLDEREMDIINVGKCGHIICGECASKFSAKILKCPMCNASINGSGFQQIFLEFE